MSKHINLDKFTLYEIHNHILYSVSITDVIESLGIIEKESFSAKLSMHFLNDLPLTYELLKNITVNDAQNIWRIAYYKPLPIVHTDINHYLLSDIHRVILDAENVSIATGLLGISSTFLTFILVGVV